MYAKLFLPVFLLASCAVQPTINLYSLDAPVETGATGNLLPLNLMIGKPSVQPGYDTSGMAYTTRPHQIEYFAKNRWVDSPDRMLLPILIEALSQKFSTVSERSSEGDLRLDTEIVLLRQEFSGNSSRIHFVLRARLSREGRNIAAREFEVFEDCRENDPYGGVVAANHAVSRLVRKLADYCAAEAMRKPESMRPAS